MNNLYDKALTIAMTAHSGQKDKAGQIYITHPIRVAQRCSLLEEKIVALLHDTLEDTDVTGEFLYDEGFTDEIINAIKSVTRLEHEGYADFISRAGKNKIGKMVKIHDLEDNMNITRLNHLSDKDLKRLNKYLHSYKYLVTKDNSELDKIND